MTVVDDVDQLTEQYQLGLEEFMKGNPEPVKELFSHRDDVTLANPLGPPARGWDQVAATIERASSFMRDGEDLHCETVAKYVTPELAYTVWIERVKAKVGGREDITQTALRVTMIFRPEEGV
jgi:ketosteroid isomerase-like protein